MFLSMTASAVVNVNNVYIAKPILIFVKRRPKKSAHIMLSDCPKDLEENREAVDWLPVSGGRSESQARADKSRLPLPADPRPTSAACAARHRRGQTATPRRATSTRCAAPSSAPADASRRAAPARRAVRRRRG